jgi:hypothetical protein
MRARHRHFNPSHAGALFSLDSRYGFSQSNNTAVQTWEDRSNNNRDATQATSANRPTYMTSIQGGQPALEFKPSTTATSLTGSVTITNDTITSLVVTRIDSGSDTFGRCVAMADTSASDTGTGHVIPCLTTTTGANLTSWRGGSKGSINYAAGTWVHFTNTYDGTNCVNRINETSSATSANSGNFTVARYSIGNAIVNGSGVLKGFVSHVSTFNFAMSDSLRKRMQFSNAFSFKLSCN